MCVQHRRYVCMHVWGVWFWFVVIVACGFCLLPHYFCFFFLDLLFLHLLFIYAATVDVNAVGFVLVVAAVIYFGWPQYCCCIVVDIQLFTKKPMSNDKHYGKGLRCGVGGDWFCISFKFLTFNSFTCLCNSLYGIFCISCFSTFRALL